MDFLNDDSSSFTKRRCPTALGMQHVLEKAVRDSLAKGYHTPHTRFDRIHRSGVSSILLKGESYSAAPDIRRVRLEERWRTPRDDFIYLDASCLLFSKDGEHRGTIDYTHMTGGHGSAVRHSGDVCDFDKGIGNHTIDVNLSKLRANISHLVFTISAWTTTLGRVVQPSVHMFDADKRHGQAELCSFEVEDLSRRDLDEQTAVLMAVLYRDGGRGWKCTALGDTCAGRQVFSQANNAGSEHFPRTLLRSHP